MGHKKRQLWEKLPMGGTSGCSRFLITKMLEKFTENCLPWKRCYGKAKDTPLSEGTGERSLEVTK